MQLRPSYLALALAISALWPSGSLLAADGEVVAIEAAAKKKAPLTLQDQGSFFYGGKKLTFDDGQFGFVNYGFVQYQTPTNPRKYPLVMWHGGGQTGKTWDTTPDGRDGYQQIFARRDYPIYVIDQPGRGRGGRLEEGLTIGDPSPNAALLFNIFRLGKWFPPAKPTFFDNVSFDKSDPVFKQYLEQATVNIGPEPVTDKFRRFQAETTGKLLDKIGASILITHSNSGQYGWVTPATRPDLVKALVAYEPAAFAFPSDAVPRPIKNTALGVEGLTGPRVISPEDFNTLTKIPILVVYGDNLATEPSQDFGIDTWRASRIRARQFAREVRKRGGTVDVVELPDVGLKGNTHFPFSDLNNVKVADHLEGWLKKNGLDAR